MRTRCMVACGAALMMIVSKYGFTDLVQGAGVYFYGTKGAVRATALFTVLPLLLAVGLLAGDSNQRNHIP